MSVAVNIQFPAGDVRALMAQMERARRLLGKDLKNSVQWAGYLLCQSLGASTKVAPKLRKIVKNPHANQKGDARYAPFGIIKYRTDGTSYFKGLRQTLRENRQNGYNAPDVIIRYVDKRTSAVISWNKTTGKRTREWTNFSTAPDVANPELAMPGIMTDKRRIIGRSGLAKKSWQWCRSNMRGGIARLMGLAHVAEVKWSGGADNPTVEVSNSLRYIQKALKSGPSDVSSAAARASNAMEHQIDKKVAQKMGFAA